MSRSLQKTEEMGIVVYWSKSNNNQGQIEETRVPLNGRKTNQ